MANLRVEVLRGLSGDFPRPRFDHHPKKLPGLVIVPNPTVMTRVDSEGSGRSGMVPVVAPEYFEVMFHV
jgi:hypothetical protein